MEETYKIQLNYYNDLCKNFEKEIQIKKDFSKYEWEELNLLKMIEWIHLEIHFHFYEKDPIFFLEKLEECRKNKDPMIQSLFWIGHLNLSFYSKKIIEMNLKRILNEWKNKEYIYFYKCIFREYQDLYYYFHENIIKKHEYFKYQLDILLESVLKDKEYFALHLEDLYFKRKYINYNFILKKINFIKENEIELKKNVFEFAHILKYYLLQGLYQHVLKHTESLTNDFLNSNYFFKNVQIKSLIKTGKIESNIITLMKILNENEENFKIIFEPQYFWKTIYYMYVYNENILLSVDYYEGILDIYYKNFLELLVKCFEIFKEHFENIEYTFLKNHFERTMYYLNKDQNLFFKIHETSINNSEKDIYYNPHCWFILCYKYILNGNFDLFESFYFSKKSWMLDYFADSILYLRILFFETIYFEKMKDWNKLYYLIEEILKLFTEKNLEIENKSDVVCRIKKDLNYLKQRNAKYFFDFTSYSFFNFVSISSKKCSNSCSICLEKCSDIEEKWIECKNCYQYISHSECLKNWIFHEHSFKKTCPLCRFDFFL